MLRYAFTRNHKAMKPFCSEFRLVVTVLLILLDFSSDFLFLSQLMGQSDLEYGRILVYGSCAALGFPILLNSLYLMKFLKCPEMVDFWFFFKRNTLGCVIVFVLSILNTSMFCLFSSHLLGLSLFNVRIPNRVKYRALAGSLITHVFEDLPQLVIMILSIIGSPRGITVITTISIFASSISLLVGVTRAFCLNLMSHTVDNLQRAEVEQDKRRTVELQARELEVQHFLDFTCSVFFL